MPQAERLFDVDKLAPRVDVSIRRAAYAQQLERIKLANAESEIARAPRYLIDRVARLAAGATMVIQGVEIPAEEVASALGAATSHPC